MYRTSTLVFATLMTALAPLTYVAAAADSRIDRSIDERERLTFTGNVHPAATGRFDEGAVSPHTALHGMQLLFKRSAQQEAALHMLMAQQLDPRSPNFQHWLTPAEFGSSFGPSDANLAAVTRWLESKGFVIEEVNSGRTYVRFAGTAANVVDAFRTEIHQFSVDGERHIANNVDPSIPAALGEVVGGVAALHDFHALPLHHVLGTLARSSATGRWAASAAQTPATAESGAQYKPNGSSFQLVTPSDFAVLYNVLPLWNAGIDGSGQTIAIAGRSAISLADVANFRAAFGLPAKAPTVVVNGVNPGVPGTADQVENTLDVEWSGAVAKGANILFVTTASTNTDGAYASAMYIVDRKLAPVLSFSYGLCEAALGAAGNAAYDSLWQQAAAEGISVFVASGDQGAAGCDGGSANGAVKGLAVNGTASTPYDVAVGGTDLDWVNLPSTSYWSAGGGAAVAAALQYIPEVPWNSTCASLAVNQANGAAAAGLDAESFCNHILQTGNGTYLLAAVGGGGGASSCATTPSGGNSACVGYAKPAWQSGVGVPPDGRRDVPDVALFAANGALGTAYVICDGSLGPCTYTAANAALAQGVGGTSVASPAMAGIMALVNQKMGAPQGNANAGLYALAALDNRATCSSTAVRANNPCNFYDITTDNDAVACTAGSPNCAVAHAGDKLGILAGNKSAVGYDMATGLGSVNAANLVTNWHLIGAPPKTVTVPSAVGQTTASAAAQFATRNLAIGTLTQLASTATAAGLIISQNPVAGTVVKALSNVNLVVSSGPARVAVPNLVNLTQAAAAAALGKAGLLLGTVKSQTSTSVPAGSIISESPAAGTSVAAGAAVGLVVSHGRT